jgi:hypothetical protein
MAVGTTRSFNGLIKEYFMDVAGVTSAHSVNDAMRAGLEALGHSGSLNNMLRAWANDQAGTSVSINTALHGAFADMVGESSKGLQSMAQEYFQPTTFNAILIKFEDEDRKFSFID